MSSLWDNLTAATKNLASVAQDVLTEDVAPDDGALSNKDLADGPQTHDVVDAALLNDELDQLREALDATEALCERQREEIARLKQGHVPVDHDDARRESELLLLKSRVRALEQDNEQLKSHAGDSEARARTALEQMQTQLVAAERDRRQLRSELDTRAAAAQQLHDCKRAQEAAESVARQLRETLDVRDAEVASMQATRELLTDELEALRAANSELQSQRAAAAAQMATMSAAGDVGAETNGENNSRHHQQQLADCQRALAASDAALRERDAQLAALPALQLQVAALTDQLAMERDTTALERREEVASLRRATERARTMDDALTAARGREDMLKAHLLEREEELETLSNENAALKVEQSRIRAELDAALDRVERFDELEQQLHATERALRNLDEAVGAMTEEHKADAVRRERVVRERVADEWKARAEKREAELGGEMAATRARLEATLMELERERHTARDWAAKCAEINREVEPLREAFAECMRKLTEAVDKDAYAVDKRLVSNLLCSYFTMADTGKRNEVLCLTLRILDVPRDRRNEIYRRNAGWLSAFSEDEHSAGGRSMSDMWIEFLLRESSERPRDDANPPLPMPPALIAPPAPNANDNNNSSSVNSNNAAVTPPPPNAK